MSDPDAFNLIDESWLPVRRRSGAVEHIPPWRINDRIADDPFTGFAWPRPDFNGAAHEFLIGLLSTVAAPADDDEWDAGWLDPLAPEELRQRCAQVVHAFELDGSGPRFMQDRDPLDGAEYKHVVALLIDAPGAQTLRNNADLFVKRAGTPVLVRAAAAMALFTLSSYAPGGGAGHRTSLRGGGPLTTLIAADHHAFRETLWGRLWPNVETREQIADRGRDGDSSGEGSTVFPWLVATRTSNPKAGGSRTTPQDVDPLQVYWGMPRRIRLLFEEADGRRCELTGADEGVVVAGYRTRNYGTDYSEGFQHPLSPYYRQNTNSVTKLPVHPKPGGISYRLWPGLVVPGKGGLREPAQVVRQWGQGRGQRVGTPRVAAFGYVMDNMKARAWVEGEMPLWRFDDAATREWVERFVRSATAGAATVARLVIGGVKSALYDRPRDASGDYGFVEERFFRDTETDFYTALNEAVAAIEADLDSDDPTLAVRTRWATVMEKAAIRLFDDYAPSTGLENHKMHRHVKAQYFLVLALRGRGKAGKSLFGDLDIPAPETTRSRRSDEEAA